VIRAKAATFIALNYRGVVDDELSAVNGMQLYAQLKQTLRPRTSCVDSYQQV